MACIKKRRDRWVIDFYDQYGKRRWKTLKKGTTKKKAREELRVIEEQVEKRTYLPDNKIPLFSEVAWDWLEYKKPNVRITTWEVLKGHVKNHFADFDGIRITWISTVRIERFITKKQEQGMNITTLRKVLGTLGQILSYAVRHKYINHNPLRDVERPRSPGNESSGQQAATVLNPEQINNLLNNVGHLFKKRAKNDGSQKRELVLNKLKERKYKTLFMLAIFSGARQGELLGLKWCDVDWENNQIHIQRTFNNGRFFSTKTRNSNRRIDLGPAIMGKLREWKLACPPNDLDLVFPNSAGLPIDHHNLVRRYFAPALKAAKLPKIRFHDLRHTYASLMIEQGENIKYIQSQLGHSSPTVTLNVYAHLMKPKNQEAARKLENTILG